MTEVLPQRIVPFYGDELIAVQDRHDTIFVLFSHLCDNLGLNRRGQTQRVQRHAVMNAGLVLVTVETEGGPQTVQCLRIDLLPLWLSGVQASRVKPELQDKLTHYQQEAAQVLWQAFKPQILVGELADSGEDNQTITHLQHIAEMGRAITALAEQQIELQRQQQHLTSRIDKAAHIIKEVQAQYSDVQIRLGVLEDTLHPATYVTDAQATEVSNAVKALAELLTGKGIGSYQSVFQELYRRFGVSSYKVIRKEQYSAALTFLDEWRRAASEQNPGS
jgi:hypothetical protein